MSKVYMVMTGQYSDRAIDSVWSTLAAATARENLLSRGTHDGADIEEFEIDGDMGTYVVVRELLAHPGGTESWIGKKLYPPDAIPKDSLIWAWASPHGRINGYPNLVNLSGHECLYPCLDVTVVTDDDEVAKKTAMERFGAIVASGRWDRFVRNAPVSSRNSPTEEIDGY